MNAQRKPERNRKASPSFRVISTALAKCQRLYSKLIADTGARRLDRKQLRAATKTADEQMRKARAMVTDYRKNGKGGGR